MNEQLTPEEVDAWCERYARIPWSMLALCCAADRQPSPLTVLQSAALNTRELEAQLRELEAQLEQLQERELWRELS
jgi:hypothetical protein